MALASSPTGPWARWATGVEACLLEQANRHTTCSVVNRVCLKTSSRKTAGGGRRGRPSAYGYSSRRLDFVYSKKPDHKTCVCNCNNYVVKIIVLPVILAEASKPAMRALG
jgi:hypothetical protein